jgi:hypothetical protein
MLGTAQRRARRKIHFIEQWRAFVEDFVAV